MSETNLGVISHLKYDMAREHPKPLLMFFDKPTPYVSEGSIEEGYLHTI
jgi:hypothetical protein